MTHRRLIEADLPIGRISAHARKDRGIRNGHIASIHMWWARRPLAACRAVTLAALLPDPVVDDQEGLTKESRELVAKFTTLARELMGDWLASDGNSKSHEAAAMAQLFQEDPGVLDSREGLRDALLDFVADFSAWDSSIDVAYLSTARRLLAAALGASDVQDVECLVLDPFAGGGAIPLESLRIGASAFASDLNPVSVLINKVMIEYIPRYGKNLMEAVSRYGDELRESVRKEIESYYSHKEGEETVAYLWARTMPCHGPNCGRTIPLLTQTTIAKRVHPPIAAFLDKSAEEGPAFEVGPVSNARPAPEGTVKGGAVSCPYCGHTIKSAEYRDASRKGELGEVMYAVVGRSKEGARTYRSVEPADRAAFQEAVQSAERIEHDRSARLARFPDEPLSEDEPRRLNVRLYGFTSWSSLFNARQKVALDAFARAVAATYARVLEAEEDPDFAAAVATTLGLSVSNMTHYLTNMSTYLSEGMISAFIQGSAIPMRADYAEANPLMGKLVGGFEFQLTKAVEALARLVKSDLRPGAVAHASATRLPLPDDSVDAVVTDPPYYFAIPYADLSDLFYVWLRRSLGRIHPQLMRDSVTPKAEEAVQNLPHSESPSVKDREHFETTMRSALEESLRVLKPDGISVLVFANATTEGWESLLRALLDAGWIVTASWPIETERAGRMLASRQSVLASSVHLVCRPRPRDGQVIGDWRDVLEELPVRVHQWIPRLRDEGVVGADAIFACLGPALELFSRYERVEKSSGETVDLQEFLEHVWAAVSREALSLVFTDADPSGFEADARLTAMWLWTLTGAVKATGDELTPIPEGGSGSYSLEYDAARKMAQGLGAHLDDLRSLVEIKKDAARLLSARERTASLFSATHDDGSRGQESRSLQVKLFDLEPSEDDPAVDFSAAPRTILDRVHQAMILFGTGRSETLRRLLSSSGVGSNARFWSLAQSLSALYPPGSEDKRWLDGVLARKKSLGY